MQNSLQLHRGFNVHKNMHFHTRFTQHTEPIAYIKCSKVASRCRETACLLIGQNTQFIKPSIIKAPNVCPGEIDLLELFANGPPGGGRGRVNPPPYT